MKPLSDEDRAKKMLDEQIDALIGVELDRIGETPFFPDGIARRVASSYNLPGKDNSADLRVKIITVAYVLDRTKRIIQRSRNGLRLWITIGAKKWQYAPATTARTVRVFRNNYQAQEQSFGARRECLDRVLAAHLAAGLGDDDPIRDAYEAALTGAEPETVAA